MISLFLKHNTFASTTKATIIPNHTSPCVDAISVCSQLRQSIKRSFNAEKEKIEKYCPTSVDSSAFAFNPLSEYNADFNIWPVLESTYKNTAAPANSTGQCSDFLFQNTRTSIAAISNASKTTIPLVCAE